ncbi:sulfatase [Kiritimatiellota bacterium B12222]|nr:sulfatase [Kiritimatiellota bacterium B12222]
MKKRPHVLFMVVDDLRPLLGCYGHKEMKTPHLDRLASEGVLFERNLSQVPICMASRASFMTSQKPFKHQIYNCKTVAELMPDLPTLNQHFASAGYRVKGTGKVYHHGSDNESQFGDGYTQTTGEAFGRGYLTEASRKLIDENSREREARGLGPEDPLGGRGPCTEIGPPDEEKYPDGAIAAWGVEQLRELKNTEDPFFLALGWRKPHLPFVAPQSYWDLYDPEMLPFPENDFMPEDMPEYTKGYHYSELRNYVDVPYGQEPLSEALDRRLLQGYRACVSFLDAQVGKVLQALDENGLREDTVVVFMVDHGFQLREHDLFCKHTAFMTSYHVPMLVRAPGVTEVGGRIAGLSENIDIFPTLCELCGLDQPAEIDGESRVNWLRTPSLGGKEAAFSVWGVSKREDPEQVIVGYTVVTDRYRYTEWTHNASGEVKARELFRLEYDPLETLNLAGRDEYVEVMQGLSLLISDWRAD